MSRTSALLLCVVAAALPGGTCVPLLDLEQSGSSADVPRSRTELTVSVLRPSSDRSVAKGAAVEVQWTSGNLTGSEAIATILLRNRDDLSETILAGGIRVTGVGTTQSFDWDTAAFDGGSFGVLVRVEAGGRIAESFSPGRITVNTPPELEFTEPTGDVRFGEDGGDADNDNADEAPSLTIRWTATDPDGDGSLSLGLDPDGDHASGNEVFILERDIPLSGGVDSFRWDGNDLDDDPVEDGVYRLFARISDDINEERFVNAGVHVTIPEVEEETPFDPSAFSIESLAEDAEFLTDDESFTIEYGVPGGRELLIDLLIDTDDNPSNGNEQVILSQRFLEEDVTADDFEWDGTDAQGDPVADGLYKVVIVANAGENTPLIEISEGLLMRRSFEDQPLVGVLSPATDQETDAGAFIQIRWRDDVPTEEAEIRIVVDDDPTPNEDVETDDPEVEVLAGRDAVPDGTVTDSYQYQVAADLLPGRFWFHVYIDRDGDAPFDHVSTSPRPIIIRDPEQQ